MPRRFAAVTVLLLSLVCTAAAPAAPRAAAPDGRAALERLKRLEGAWAGKAGMGGDASDVNVRYRVTAGGNAVTETVFEGTPHEMTTVFYLEQGALALTHYCASGHHPRMKWNRASSADEWVFDFDGPANRFDPAKDFHMHDAHVWFDGEDHVRSEWSSMDQGKPSHVAAFDLRRVK